MAKRISPHFMLGTTWIGNDGHTYKLRRQDHPYLTISITSYIGSLGAMHYYARINGEKPEIYDADEKQYYMCGGYGDNKPCLYGIFSFDALRILTSIELDMSNEPLGDIGDETGKFNSPLEAFDAAIDAALENFRDTKRLHWDVKFESCGEELDYKEGWRLTDLELKKEHLLSLFGKWDDE